MKVCAILYVVIVIFMIIIPVNANSTGFGELSTTEIYSFQVNNNLYTEISAIAVGDIDGDGNNEIVVTYDNIANSSISNISVYKFVSGEILEIGSISNFTTGTQGLIYGNPTNTYIYDMNNDSKGELFITGEYNGSNGVFVFGYNSSSEKLFEITHFYNGTDSAVIRDGNESYLAVAGDGIYKINNGSFERIVSTDLPSGYIRTGNFSNDSNLLILDSTYIYFYNFSNGTLSLSGYVDLDIEVPGWGNDVYYMSSFCTGYFTNNSFQNIFVVTYHNGYAIVGKENNTYTQIYTGVLNISESYNAVSSYPVVFENTTYVVVGFDNSIYAPLFRVYAFYSNITNETSVPPEDGGTRVVYSGDVNNDGVNEIIVGGSNSGYVRVFSLSQSQVPEFNVIFFLPLLLISTFLIKRTGRG